MYHIQNFLSLGLMEPVYPLSITGITEATANIKGEIKTYNLPISIYYKLPDIPNISKIIRPYDMLFKFDDMIEKFEIYIKNWFRKAELLKPIYDLYFATLYNPRMYLGNKFLNLIQALEVYHRRIINKLVMNQEKCDGIVKECLDIISQNYKEHFEQILKYANEPSLRRRLKDIIKKYENLLDKFIGNKNAQNSFINKVVNTRNYLIHYDLEVKEKSESTKELFNLTQNLKTIVEICLLNEIGFNLEKIENLISSIQRSTYLQT
jgi:hypothetical protein